jgi:hypothetical protein
MSGASDRPSTPTVKTVRLLLEADIIAHVAAVRDAAAGIARFDGAHDPVILAHELRAMRARIDAALKLLGGGHA